MTRSKNLTSADVDQIVGILDCWSGKLTWELLAEAVERRLYARYTRQALDKHERVKTAFRVRKDALLQTKDLGALTPTGSPELDASAQRIARLEGENERLQAQNQHLLEKFARWAYNAHTHGLAEALLEQAMTPVDRDRTEQRPRLSVVGQGRN
jgi:hypothetical protein